MGIQQSCRTLIDLFEQSSGRVELENKNYLEIVRTKRQETLTFGELRRKAYEFAAFLVSDKDIRLQDKIAILGKNCADWDVALWGVILAGAVPVLIDPEGRAEAVKKHLLAADTRLLIMAADWQEEPSREHLKEFTSAEGIGLIEMTVYEQRVKVPAKKLGTEVSAEDTAVILCTSGTTGNPREVQITHRNLICNIQGMLDAVAISESDKLGHIMPPHHSFGFTVGKLIPLWVGATNLYTTRYRQIGRLIAERHITIFVGVPAVFAAIARRIEDRLAAQKQRSLLVRLTDHYFPKLVGRMIIKKAGWDRLRFFVCGAAAVPRPVMETFWRRGLELREGYGMTENSPVYGFNERRDKLGSVGRPIPTVTITIVDEKGKALSAGREGEIVIGGLCVFKGYYKDIETTEKTTKTDADGNRLLYTGDLGYLDKDGYLYITGRKKHLIVLPSGKNINPEMVERVLSRADYVDELVVVPGHLRSGIHADEEAVGVIVRPNFKQIRANTKLCRRELIDKPEVLRNLIWESINKCQHESRELASFEKVPSKHLVEIEVNDFHKTSTGKIKRHSYLKP